MNVSTPDKKVLSTPTMLKNGVTVSVDGLEASTISITPLNVIF